MFSNGNKSVERYNVGLIGCGRMGCRTSERVKKNLPAGWLPLNHAEAILKVSGLNLDSLCDVDENNLLDASRRFNIKKTFCSYSDLISKTNPHLLSVATRTDKRCEIISWGINNGVKGIHTEKPISNNLKDCMNVISQARTSGVKMTYGTYRRYMGIYRKAKEITMGGDLGDIVEIEIEHGKSPLLWTHPHSIDLMLFFSGAMDVEFVQASCIIEQQHIRGNIVDSDPLLNYAFVKFANGINGIITSAPGMNTRISGTKGVLTIVEDGSGIQIRKSGNSSPYLIREENLTFPPTESGTVTAFRELHKAITAGGSQGIDYEDIVLSQMILFAIVTSSLQSGRAIVKKEVNPELTVTGRIGHFYA